MSDDFRNAWMAAVEVIRERDAEIRELKQRLSATRYQFQPVKALCTYCEEVHDTRLACPAYVAQSANNCDICGWKGYLFTLSGDAMAPCPVCNAGDDTEIVPEREVATNLRGGVDPLGDETASVSSNNRG